MKLERKLLLILPAVLVTVFLLTCNAHAETTKAGVITGSVVNLRQNPNTSSKILAQLVRDTKVIVIGSEGNWCNVTYNDITGWVHGDYIKVHDLAAGVGTVTGSVVNVRSKPDINSEVLTKVKKGERFEYYEKKEDWYRISIAEGRYGWINAAYFDTVTKAASRGQSDKASMAAADDSGQNEAPAEVSADIRAQIVEYAKKFLGVKYVYGGSTPKGFDCSGFVKYVFDHFNISLPRSSRDMGNGGTAIKKDELLPGDLVFFDTNGGLNGINHVGIYIGGGKFIHASSSIGRKVTITSLNDSFYVKTYMRARRYIKD